jgi:hypothetical protein
LYKGSNRNEKYLPFDDMGGDCTSFTSQALWAGCLRDPREKSSNLQPVYWYDNVALKDPNLREGDWSTWIYASELYKFLTMVLDYTAIEYQGSVPYINGVNEEGARDLKWQNWLNSNRHFVQEGDVVFLDQDFGNWSHAVFIIGWGAQTYFPNQAQDPNIQKPLVVEHSTTFADNDWQPRAIDNTGGPIDRIAIVHID